jgi:hypothetical protein
VSAFATRRATPSAAETARETCIAAEIMCGVHTHGADAAVIARQGHPRRQPLDHLTVDDADVYYATYGDGTTPGNVFRLHR